MARKSVKRMAADKPPAEIKFLLNSRGLTFADVDRAYGLKEGAARKAVRHPYFDAEFAIAEMLGTSPRQLWPSRFDAETGVRLTPQPSKNYTDQPRLRASQKQKAA
jgi:lambda repressor-like predicted transcriptional regulator